jgi:hypothetical protein
LEEIDALFAAPGYESYHHGAGADEKIVESDGSNTSHLEEKAVTKS